VSHNSTASASANAVLLDSISVQRCVLIVDSASGATYKCQFSVIMLHCCDINYVNGYKGDSY